jgi:hypothetical protein
MGKIRVVAGWLYGKIRVVVVGHRWKHKGGLWSSTLVTGYYMDNDGNRDILITNNDINHDLTELDFVIVLPMKSFKKWLLLAENKR